MARQPKLFTNPKEPVTRDSLIQWLYSTGWFEGHIRKRMSPLDYKQAEDYTQSCWEELLRVPESKLLEIWHKGKPKFINYCKALISNQVYSGSSKTFKENKQWCQIEIPLEDSQWTALEETGTTKMIQQFPVINRDKNIAPNQRVHFEYDGSIEIQSEINLYEDDRNFEEI